MICLIIGGIGMASIYWLPPVVGDGNSYALLISFGLMGIAWSSILSMPYAMLSGAIPGKHMGFFMGFFNVFICLPQIIASLGGLNYLKDKIFGEPSINAMLLGGALMCIAGFLSLTIRDVDDEKARKPIDKNPFDII